MDMQVTLAQAIAAINMVTKQVSRYNDELSKVAYETISKGEFAEQPDRGFDEVFSDLVSAQLDLINLKVIIRQVNVAETIDWNGEDVSLAKAIELAKTIREQSRTLFPFGRVKKKEPTRSYGSTEVSYRIANFNPAGVAEVSSRYEKDANRLSSLIEARNHGITLDIPFLDKYL
jgi:hypothetical protein